MIMKGELGIFECWRGHKQERDHQFI